MSNVLVNTDLVAREVLKRAHEKARFIPTISRQYDDSFNGKVDKHGANLKVRNPNEYSVRSGRVMDAQDQAEATQTITVGTQVGVDMKFNSAELALDIADLQERYINPAAERLISHIESAVLQGATKKVWNLAGAAGTVPGVSGDTSMVGQARAKINQGLAPMDDRSLQIDSDTMASIVNGNKALFHEGAQVSGAFSEGFYKRVAGFDWYENERILSLTNGSDASGTVNDGAIASGDAALTIASTNYVEGQVFTLGLAGTRVERVHPESKVSYGYLQQFVATNTGTTSLTFDPPYILTGAKQNVSALPVNGEAITFFGSANVAYKNALAYHKDFCVFVSADLPKMADAAKCTVRRREGISLRVWEGSDIVNDELYMRLDVLYGFKVLKPEWACRINCT